AVLLAVDGRFEAVALWHPRDAEQGEARRVVSELELPYDAGLVSTVHRTGEPLVFQDLTPERFRTASGKRFDALTDLLRPTAVALVPLRTGGRAIGVLVSFRGPHPVAHSRFDEDELTFLRELADRMALGIHAERSAVERLAAETALRAS